MEAASLCKPVCHEEFLQNRSDSTCRHGSVNMFSSFGPAHEQPATFSEMASMLPVLREEPEKGPLHQICAMSY